MFNQIKNIIKNNSVFKLTNRILFDTHKPPSLGRWGLLHDNRVNLRVDWSNEDHCGPCGNLKLENKKIKLNQNSLK